jgi:hypothetical protein
VQPPLALVRLGPQVARPADQNRVEVLRPVQVADGHVEHRTREVESHARKYFSGDGRDGHRSFVVAAM